jgi:succinyldiaminopimelate transaminase
MKFNPVLERLSTYPFVQLEDAKRKAAELIGELIDFGVGDPMETTPQFIRRALVESIAEKSSYPRAAGLPETRAAIAGWCKRRFGVEVDPETEVLPSSGSKEAIFGLAQIAVDRSADKNVVVIPEPGYPIPLRGAELNGCRVLKLPLREENGFLPDLESIDDVTWKNIALFWVNYPNNPTGAVAPLSFYERLAFKAIEHDFLLASDEAYSEIYFGEPPHSALEVTDRSNVVVFNTLSKRSAMTGYRSGSIVAGRSVMAVMQRYRPLAGTASPEFIQRAAAAAWQEETHVDEMRTIYAAKRAVIEPFLTGKGLRIAGSEATFYLWVATPDGESAESFALHLLQGGVVVAPGTFFGESGNGYVRMALVPTLEQCHKTIDLLDEVI